jgi:hypothetical protein
MVQQGECMTLHSEEYLSKTHITSTAVALSSPVLFLDARHHHSWKVMHAWSILLCCLLHGNVLPPWLQVAGAGAVSF